MNRQERIAHARHRVEELHQLQAAGLINRDGHFFPCGVHYPPITMYPPTTADDFLSNYTLPANDAFVLYVHIPFCARRCTFCHYPVLTRSDDGEKEGYLDLLIREMDLWREKLGVETFNARSILIAGGTPTYLAPDQFRRFHQAMAERVNMDGCTQITYDVHPSDLLGEDGSERLAVMREYGSTRLTLGLQSLDDEVLKHMNRGHTVAQAFEAIQRCRDAGFEDLCIEFIYGYPNLDMDTWIETIERAISMDCEEIQLYRLKIVPYGDSPGPIERLYARKPEQFCSSDEAILMKQIAQDMLEESGYAQNLTRVFTRGEHNTSHYATDQCCALEDCIGFGLSAFSSMRDRFAINTASMEDYFARIKAGEIPLNRGLVRSREQQLRWSIALPLKNDTAGIRKALFTLRTGEDIDVFRPQIDALKGFGLIDESDTHVWLTRRGRFFADEVIAQFHHPRHIPFPPEAFADGPLKMLARPLGDGERIGEDERRIRTTEGIYWGSPEHQGA